MRRVSVIFRMHQKCQEGATEWRRDPYLVHRSIYFHWNDEICVVHRLLERQEALMWEERRRRRLTHKSLTLKELWTSVSSRSMTTQIFPESFDLTGGSSGFTWTLETVPFSSTSRGALLLTGRGSGWSRHRQQKKLEKKPLLRGFLVEMEGKEPAGEEASEPKRCRDTGKKKTLEERERVLAVC